MAADSLRRNIVCTFEQDMSTGESMPHLTFPNETGEYRSARNALLAEEIALRQQIEAVAAHRRALPPGGEVPEDYLFERIGTN
jgi:predicted dithiol-disulfide oxidoreductase (DUF899 family)